MLATDKQLNQQHQHQRFPRPVWVSWLGQDLGRLAGVWEQADQGPGVTILSLPLSEHKNISSVSYSETIEVQAMTEEAVNDDYSNTDLDQVFMYMKGVRYTKSVEGFENQTGEVHTIHTESGFWLEARSDDPSLDSLGSVVHTADNPHGVTVNSNGDAARVTCQGAASTCMAEEYEMLMDIYSGKPLNYTCPGESSSDDVLSNSASPAIPGQDIAAAAAPAIHLREATKGLNITEFWRWNVSSTENLPAGQDRIAGMPFLERTVDEGNGKTNQMLQYIEMIYLRSFPGCNGERGLFPHIMVNTLKASTKAEGLAPQPGHSLGETSLVERIAAAPSATERLELLKPLAWVHIPKCGVSFANVLLGFSELWGPCSDSHARLESHGRDACDTAFSDATAQCPGTMTSPFPDPSAGLFCGHPMLGATYAQTQGHLMAMFRQPEQRILSSYYDVKEDGLVVGGWVSPVPPSSASEYAVAAQGCMTKMLTRAETAGGLTGEDPCAPPAVSAEETVLARVRVLQDFAFVGITEEWDLSICLFHAKFGGSCLESDLANIHAGSNASAQFYDTSVLEGFVDESDGAVYSSAKTVFRSDLTRYGLSYAVCDQLCPSPDAPQQPDQTALMQLKVQVDKAVRHAREEVGRAQGKLRSSAEHGPIPLGYTMLSTDPKASAEYFVKWYGATALSLPQYPGVERAAVTLPPMLQHVPAALPLLVFIKDESLPAGNQNITDLVLKIKRDMVTGASGEFAYSFRFDNHMAFRNVKEMVELATPQLEAGLPMIGIYHLEDPTEIPKRGLGGNLDVQIPHTMQLLQTKGAAGQMPGVLNYLQDDCRADMPYIEEVGAWYKSTFWVANPPAAAKFAVDVLGASYMESPYPQVPRPGCTQAAWVTLPTLFQLHFVKAPEYQRYPTEIADATSSVLSSRNLTAGVFDLMMHESLMLSVASLDPYIETLKAINCPSLLVRAGPQELALFIGVPENALVIQLRSAHLSVLAPSLVDVPAQQFVSAVALAAIGA